MKYLILLSFVCIVMGLLFSECSKNDHAGSDLDSGILMDWSKFDGCGWVIELDNHDHTILEPDNLSQFSIDLTDSLSVKISYYINPDQSSSCMAGTVIHLNEISAN
jgi:hypothetical protein